MILKYDMLQTGWGRAEIISEKCNVIYEPSYVSDPYGDMIRAVCSIVPGLCYERPPAENSEVNWNMEPIHITISLAYKEPEIAIDIIEYDESEPNVKKSIILSEKVAAENLIGHLIDSGKSMLLKYGMIGYRTNSVNFEFPVSAFLKLMNYKEKKAKLNAVKAASSQLFSSCIHTELQKLAALN